LNFNHRPPALRAVIRRNLLPVLEAALADTPSVFLAGPRQAGTGAEASLLLDRPELLGPMLETFVVAEVIKQVSRLRPTVHHYRTHTGQEVDGVLEDRRGRVVGLEVKAASGIGPADLRGLQALAGVAGDRFVRGIVLHVGKEVPFGPNLQAMPVSALWRAK
jgi:predicted AAA+ superfamily ATPase